MSVSKNQGEGNIEAARRYDQSQREFVESGKVQQAAKAAAPRTDEEARDLERAEQEGRSHGKGEDTAVLNSKHSPKPDHKR